ncbi:MAG TPA: flavin reductase [Deltaproteobacteria bacterium]|nr:flavin reductase [Deltaproteobacteria bacterium]
MVHGVYVIGTVLDGRVNAMTAAWVARASFVPPLVTVAVGRTRFSHDMILSSGVFSVNVMGPGDVELARHFGFKTGRKVDKFRDVPYDTAVTGSPILKGCAAWLDCRLSASHEAGDHTLVVGEVVDGGVNPAVEQALVYDRKRFFR